MATYKKWKDAQKNPLDVTELDLDAKQLPRVTWPKAKALPKEIAHFVHLKKLTLRASNLGWLCDELATLTELEVLHIDNADRDLEFGDLLARLPALRELELYNVGLTGPVALPPTLESLALPENAGLDLAAWADTIEALPKLGSLSLTQLGLSELTLRLPRLESLNLAVNHFTALPAAVRGMPRLHTLWMNGNPMTELPDWIGELHALRTIGLESVPLEDAEVTALGNVLPNCAVVRRSAEEVDAEVAKWSRVFARHK